MFTGSSIKLFVESIEGFAFSKEKSESLCHKRESMRNARERKLHCDSPARIFILNPTKEKVDFWS